MKIRKMLFVGIIITIASVLLGIKIHQYNPRCIIENPKNVELISLKYHDSEVSVDEKKVIDILSKYSSKETSTNYFPYESSKIYIEILLNENDKPKHILLGDFNVWSNIGSTGVYEIVNSKNLREEIESLFSADGSRVLATVDDVKITQKQVDIKKKDSEFSQQEKTFSDKEVLDKLIEEQLLLIKAKELNITLSDDEVKKNYKEMLKSMSSKQYNEGDEEKLSVNDLEGLRSMFIIQRTKAELGADVNQYLEQLKHLIIIKYYN